jgi:NAD(P)-dependent dehydrogenase (short-subunit alcohol dehydrogenase family)
MAGRKGRDLSGKVVAITGASAGVGRATVRSFAERGATIGLLARGEDGLKAARREVEAAGGGAIDLPCDVSDGDAVERAADAIERELGPIDVWVNNAMVGVFDEFLDVRPEDFRRVTDVTYLGVVNGTRSALRRMTARDRGTIVQVGSALAFRGIPLQAAYCGAKHAIQGYTESVRTELLHRRSSVRIVQVHLPALNTPQFHWVKTDLERHPQPVPPIYQPEVAARAIVWAATHRRRQLFVGAPTVLTVWADRFVPGLLDRYLGRTGYGGQQAAWPIEPGRPDNLYAPVAGDQGAHGEFDDVARSRSLQLWATTHRPLVGAAAAVALGGLAALRSRG